jgi:predicted CoA-binding protein
MITVMAPSQTHSNPPEADIEALLRSAKRIAVIGLSPNPVRTSHSVARYLQQRGYEIVPVNPGQDRWLGLPCYPDLAAVPGRVDVVDVFRASEHVAAIVEQFLARDDGALWLQEGVIDHAAALRADAAGRTVVMDRCTAKVAAVL